MKQLTLGSLFDGSGGFPLAGAINGIAPLWASEIEPYPLRVTAARFPTMTQLGDVTQIKGSAIAPVDIITFGSPCQDLSVAGAQRGIHGGTRSSLFFEAIRIIREMREHDKAAGRTDGDVRPRFAVWENVPGAFSSGGGSDFRAVLENLAAIPADGVSIPRPPKGKWAGAGCVVGDGWSIAWRTYDAQYWGVPQRRRRIYLVADFGSERAGEVLFERESLRGDPAQSGEERQGAPADVAGGIGGGCVAGIGAFMGGQGAQARSLAWYNDGTTPTLRASASGTNQVPDVCYSIEGHVADRNTGQNGRGWAEGYAHTLNATDRHVVCYPETARSLCARGDSSPCVDRGQNVVCYDARGNGDGKTAPTLTGDHQRTISDYTALCVGNGQLNQMSMAEQANTLDCMHDQQAVIYPGVGITSPQNGNNPKPGDAAPSLTNDSRNYLVVKAYPPRKYIIRRLTPLECCRLQGFPDWWEDGAEGSDTARYKMWGNGIALPCAADVLRRIAKEVREHGTD